MDWRELFANVNEALHFLGHLFSVPAIQLFNKEINYAPYFLGHTLRESICLYVVDKSIVIKNNITTVRSEQKNDDALFPLNN